MFRKKEKEKGNKAKGHMPVQALYLRGNKRQAKHPPTAEYLTSFLISSYMGDYKQGIAPTYYHIGTSILLSLLRLGLVVGY